MGPGDLIRAHGMWCAEPRPLHQDRVVVSGRANQCALGQKLKSLTQLWHKTLIIISQTSSWLCNNPHISISKWCKIEFIHFLTLRDYVILLNIMNILDADILMAHKDAVTVLEHLCCFAKYINAEVFTTRPRGIRHFYSSYVEIFYMNTYRKWAHSEAILQKGWNQTAWKK